MNARKAQQLVGAIGIVLALGLLWRTTRSQDRGIGVLARSGYWIMFAMTAAWFAAAKAAFVLPPRGELRLPLMIAGAGVAVSFAAAPVEFKVLSDETNLLSVSQAMYQNKQALHPTMGKWYYDNFNATFVSAPSRPLMFPFLLSLVHGLAGYHAWNPFVLNAMVLFVLLFLVAMTTQSRLGPLDAIAACLLVLSQPIIPITAASGGFDLLSVLLMFAALLAAHHHLRVGTPDSLALVWMTLLVYSQVRYESVIAIPLVMGYLGARGYIPTKMIAARFAYFGWGLLFLFPWFLQRHLNRNMFENPPGVPPFSVNHFVRHLSELVRVNLDFQFFFPYDNLLNLIGAILAMALLVSLASRRFADCRRQQIDLVILSVLMIGSGLGIFLSHHMGDASHPTQARFFIPVCLALAGMPVLARRFRPEWYSSAWLLAASLGLFALYLPVVGESRIMHTLILPRETRFAMQCLKTFGHQRLLTISDRSGQYAAMEFGALDFPTARAAADGLLHELQQRLYDEIVVIQQVPYATDRPIEEHELPASFKLEIVAERQMTAEYKLRISRSAVLAGEQGGGESDSFRTPPK